MNSFLAARPIPLMGLVLVVFCVIAPQPFAQALPWYERALIGMEVGPTGAQWGSDPRDTGYAAQFNGKDIVEKQIDIGSEYLVIWGRDSEWAYYNSELMPKAPGLGDRDPIREAVEAAEPHELPVIVYCVVQAGGMTWESHPEFRMIGSDGAEIGGRVCLNGPYREFVKGLLGEMLAYGIDGFHVDMVDQGFGPPYGCWCEHCQKLFAAEYHVPMPDGVTWDAAWDRMLEFRYNSSARFEEEMRDYVKSRDPDCSIDFNYHGYPPFSFEVGQRPVQHAHIGDFVTCESGVWGFGALGVGLTAECVRATGPDTVYQVVMQRGVRFYHDQTTRPLHDMRWEMMTLLAHGAQVTIVDKTPFSGALDPLAYGRIDTIFDEVHAKREHFGQTPVYDAGIYYSQRARDWYGREDKDKYQQPFFGAHKALTYEHIPAGVLLDEAMSVDRLAEFPVVILPNTAIVSEDEVQRFRTYVENGGKLIIEGISGLYDRMSAPQTQSSLEELIGATVKERIDDADNYVRFALIEDRFASLLTDVPSDWPLLVYSPAVVYEPTRATPIGELVKPVRRTRQKEGKEGTTFPSSAGEPAGPAILFNRIGKGMVLTFAASPSAATASEYRTPEARFLLRNAVRFLHPAPIVQISAPRNVEAVVTDDVQTKTLRIHLLGYNAPPGTTGPKRPWVIPDLIEDKPLYRAELQVRRPMANATAVSSSTEVTQENNLVRLLVNDVHEVIVINYE